MEIFIFWIIFSFVAGAVGSGRKIGFAGAFFISLFLSPLIGLIVALASKDKKTAELQEKMISQIDNKESKPLSTELESLEDLRKRGILSDNEFNQAKERLLIGPVKDF